MLPLLKCQVFFNSAHIGGAVDVLAAERTGLLTSLLVELARSKDEADFPPPPDAAMVCMIVCGCERARVAVRVCACESVHMCVCVWSHIFIGPLV